MGETRMFEGLEIFQLAGGVARHAASRQAVVAQNIANADTPGYRARDAGKENRCRRKSRG